MGLYRQARRHPGSSAAALVLTTIEAQVHKWQEDIFEHVVIKFMRDLCPVEGTNFEDDSALSGCTRRL